MTSISGFILCLAEKNQSSLESLSTLQSHFQQPTFCLEVKERQEAPKAYLVHQPLQVFHETSVIQLEAQFDDSQKLYQWYHLKWSTNYSNISTKSFGILNNHVTKTPYFAGTSGTCRRVTSLKPKACDLSHDGVNYLLDAPWRSLCIAENHLGSRVAGALGRFLSTSIEVLDVLQSPSNAAIIQGKHSVHDQKANSSDKESKPIPMQFSADIHSWIENQTNAPFFHCSNK